MAKAPVPSHIRPSIYKKPGHDEEPRWVLFYWDFEDGWKSCTHWEFVSAVHCFTRWLFVNGRLAPPPLCHDCRMPNTNCCCG
jgi:hypothetical protein